MSLALERYSVSTDPDRADDGSAFTVLTIALPRSKHTGELSLSGLRMVAFVFKWEMEEGRVPWTKMPKTRVSSWDRFFGWTWIGPPTGYWPPTLSSTAIPLPGIKSGLTVSGIPGGQVSMPNPGIFISETWRRAVGRRSTGRRPPVRAEKIAAGTAIRATSPIPIITGIITTTTARSRLLFPGDGIWSRRGTFGSGGTGLSGQPPPQLAGKLFLWGFRHGFHPFLPDGGRRGDRWQGLERRTGTGLRLRPPY